MIVPTMTLDEIAKEIINDTYNLNEYYVNFGQKTILKMKKIKLGYFNKWVEWESPRKNKWYFKMLIKRRTHSNYELDFHSHSFVYAHTKHRLIIINNASMKGVVNDTLLYSKDSCMIRTKHFFERYNERFLNNSDMGFIDIVKTYFENIKPMLVTNFDNGETQNVQIATEDGVELGYVFKDYSLCNTFVSKEMLFKNQIEAWEDAKQGLENLINIRRINKW